MVGGTRFHRWIHKASLGRNAGKRKDSFREEGKKRALAARTVYVSLDRADAIIEGGSFLFNFKFLISDFLISNSNFRLSIPHPLQVV